MKKQHRTDEALAMHVSAVSIFINVALSAFKLLAGLIAHSGAMISDAVHSASDVFSTFIVIAGVRLSGRAADANHRYGHERLECVASILLSVLLAPDREAAAVFLVLGYYPIVKPRLEKTKTPWLWKAVLFNVSIVTMYWLLMHLFGLDALME